MKRTRETERERERDREKERKKERAKYIYRNILMQEWIASRSRLTVRTFTALGLPFFLGTRKASFVDFTHRCMAVITSASVACRIPRRTASV